MTVKLSTWTQPSVYHPPQTLASTASSPSLKRCSFRDGALIFNHINKPYGYSLFGYRNLSKYRVKQVWRSCSSSTDSSSHFSNKEFANELQELATRFHMSESETETIYVSDSADLNKTKNIFDPLDQPDWPEEDDNLSSISASIEQKAKSVDLPLSIRMIKRKKQAEEGFREVSHSAHCSVKKAFSSMVFIIRELHCFTIQMREMIVYEDLQEILSRVHTEMHASFVWLFQQVFSRTPTLMVHVMILLANYSVYSMTTIAATPLPPPAIETVYIHEYQNRNKFDSSVSGRETRDFSVQSNSGKTISIDGGGREGGNFRPTLSGTDGGGKLGSTRTIVPDIREKECVSGKEERDEEVRLWNSIVNEATKMQFRDEALNHKTLQMFISPVSAKVETEDYSYYFGTEMSYRTGLAQDPVNPLLLANYAQFLYLVAHDYDRAEEYFKRAVKVAPPDAEAMSKYASFLWHAKKDFGGAEETFLKAISADPSNSYYAADYSHFLFSTGSEDVCFPDDAPDQA